MAQQQPIELAMPDGQVVWAMVERQGPRDTGLGDQATQRIEGFQQSLHAVAENVRAAVATARPEEVSVEFGLELAAGKHGVVAALTGVGGKATFKVAMKWTAPAPDATASAQTATVVAPPTSPSPAEA
ncbi:CU044_2847 family protein [Streptomyces sp. NPDC004008]